MLSATAVHSTAPHAAAAPHAAEQAMPSLAAAPSIQSHPLTPSASIDSSEFDVGPTRPPRTVGCTSLPSRTAQLTLQVPQPAAPSAAATPFATALLPLSEPAPPHAALLNEARLKAVQQASQKLRQHWLCRIKTEAPPHRRARALLSAHVGMLLGGIGGCMLAVKLNLGLFAAVGMGIAGVWLLGAMLGGVVLVLNHLMPQIRQQLIRRLYAPEQQILQLDYAPLRQLDLPKTLALLPPETQQILKDAEEIYCNMNNLEPTVWQLRKSATVWCKEKFVHPRRTASRASLQHRAMRRTSSVGNSQMRQASF